MQVILKKDLAGLGEAGDIVNVSPGYGRNFLIPRGFAIASSEGGLRDLDHQKRLADAIKRKKLASAKELAQQLEGVAVSIRREAGEDEKLFGSVTNRDISEALAAEGIEIDRKLIQLEEAIRRIGLYTVAVRVHRDIEANVRVYVIRG